LQILSNLGSDDHKPSPSFWKFVQIFLHKHDIKEIKSHPQLSTEIGYCRAFVRKALNDSLLSSYFKNIRKSPKSIKSYYHPYSFLYDDELSEAAENLMMGFESLVSFNLPCNSSLLNSWEDKSLELSGCKKIANISRMHKRFYKFLFSIYATSKIFATSLRRRCGKRFNRNYFNRQS
jgi:hypothetical protein